MALETMYPKLKSDLNVREEIVKVPRLPYKPTTSRVNELLAKMH